MIAASWVLADLVASAGLPADALRGDGSAVISDVVHDSRAVRPGALFCCVSGAHVDGHHFAADAVRAGATALLAEHPIDADVAQIVVADTRSAMGALAAAFHGHPSRALTMVGITGTNGKTTTTSLLAAVLDEAGLAPGVIGTLTGTHTTPESPDLQRELARFVAEGRRSVVMEVSSHALAMHRVAGSHFDLAVFTNLGRDHLDLHGNVERYFAAKALLFTPALADRGITNTDDPHGRLLFDASPIPMEGYSLQDVSDVEVDTTRHSYRWRGQRIEVAIGGSFNVMNSLAAATASAGLGIEPEVVARGLAKAEPVPGRFEPVHAGQSFDVIVDFAHTPDGMREALSAARRAVGAGRVIAVFGCGGDRDREKRPEMGEVAASLADFVVITSDNPRSEDPLEIINAVLAGVPASYRDRVVTEPDRRLSFVAAFRQAQPGDVVLIAGKGHETTQTIGDSVLPFDDRVVARAVLEARA